jgi:hypothetical protein
VRIIQYQKIEPATSRTWFARLKPEDRSWLQAEIVSFLVAVTETSSQTTRDPWFTVSSPCRELWGRSQQYPGANTMLSVLSGVYRKLERSSDISARQVEFVNRIGSIIDQLGTDTEQFKPFRLEQCLTV